MQVSTIIPLYNKAKTVDRAINSVLKQKGVEVEIIVVDDGSTDGSQKIVKKFKDNIKYIHQENSGPSIARNRGVEESKGTYISFLDADDEYLPGCLEAHIKCRELKPNIKITLSSFRVMNDGILEHEEFIGKKVGGLEAINDFSYSHQFLADLVINSNSGSICIDRSLFNYLGGFDADLHCWEITDFALRALLASPHIGILNSIYLITHQQTSGSQFSYTQNNPAYAHHFGNKIIDQMPQIPDSQKNILLRQTRYILNELLQHGTLNQFRQLAGRACPKLKSYGESNRLCTLSRFPDFLLRLSRILLTHKFPT